MKTVFLKVEYLFNLQRIGLLLTNMNRLDYVRT